MRCAQACVPERGSIRRGVHVEGAGADGMSSARDAEASAAERRDGATLRGVRRPDVSDGCSHV